MKLYDIIAGAQNGQAIENLARAAHVPPEQLDIAIQTVLPEFSQAIERNTLSRGGLADLVRALGDGHHEIILDNPAALTDPRVVADGQEILGYVLGSPDRSRAVAMKAAQAAGLGDNLIRMLMPIIAQMVMGAIAKWAKGGLGDVIQKLPGGVGGGGQGGGGGFPFPMPQGQPGPSRGQARGGGGFELPRSDIPDGGYPMPPMPGGLPGSGSGGTSRQQRNDDDQDAQAGGSGGGFQIPWPRPQSGGNPRAGGQSPFPFPFPFPQQQDETPEPDQAPPPRQSQRRSSGGTSGGFGLPDMERPSGGFPMPPIPGGSAGGGGFPMPQSGGTGLPMPSPGPANNPYGDLSDILRRGAKIEGTPSTGIVRKALGGLLGFGGGGIMSWFVRLIVMRWGWGLLKRFLGRALTGR